MPRAAGKKANAAKHREALKQGKIIAPPHVDDPSISTDPTFKPVPLDSDGNDESRHENKGSVTRSDLVRISVSLLGCFPSLTYLERERSENGGTRTQTSPRGQLIHAPRLGEIVLEKPREKLRKLTHPTCSRA
jgi:hypothetical protein